VSITIAIIISIVLALIILSRVGVTRDEIKGSRLGDWIHWHFGYNLS
jgi:hypothetical protein